MDATTTVVIHGNRANHVGSFSTQCTRLRFDTCPSAVNRELGIRMPRGRSTFTKRQKEHTRQQRQRDKAERRNQRRQEKPVEGSVDETAELREHAAAQAALFNMGIEETETTDKSTPDGRIGERRRLQVSGSLMPGNQT